MKTLTNNFSFLRTSILFIALILCTYSSLSQDWVRMYNGPSSGSDEGTYTCTDNQGNIYVTGTSYDQNWKCTLWKYDQSGTLIWVRTFNVAGAGYGIGKKILLSPGGGVFICAGVLQANLKYDFYLIKYDVNGNLQSSARYGEPAEHDNFADASFDINGNIIVAVNGKTNINNPDFDIILLKYNQMCVVQYYQSFNIGTWAETAKKVLVDNAGNIYVAGERSFNSNYDLLAVKYDPQLQYIGYYTYASYNDGNDYLYSAVIAPGGGLILSGATCNSTPRESDFTIIKVSQNLTYEWMSARSFVPGFAEYANDICLDNSGNIYSCGTASDTSGFNTKILTVKYDIFGNVIWSRTYDRGPGGNGYNAAKKICMDMFGNIYIAGHSASQSTDCDAMILKYDNAGNQGFVYNYNGAAFEQDEFYDITVSPDGKISACGRTANLFNNAVNYDMIIVKLTGVMTGVTGNENQIPSDYSLSQNYPNPFNPGTMISFSLPKASFVKMVVYDITGKEVEILVNEAMNAGSYEVDFNASRLTSGVYFYRITADGFTETKKMILTK